MKKKLDITKVPVESVKLMWLSPIIEQFSGVFLTKEQMDWISPKGAFQINKLRGVCLIESEVINNADEYSKSKQQKI